MSGITFTGLGSGLQVNDIVESIVGAERAPFESTVNRREAILTTDISAVGALKSALEKVQKSISNLTDESEYQQRTTKGDDDYISISSTKEAGVGGYSVNVDNLASAHKLMSSAIDETSAVGEGTLTIASGSNSFDISVSDTATLSEIKDLINESVDNDTVIATIINDGTNDRLVLTAKETGLVNEITITVDDIGDGDDVDNISGLSRLAYDSGAGVTNLSQIDPAGDANITIDGTVTVSSATNEFKNVIDGIDITAKKAQEVGDDISQITISEDNSNIKETLESFITAYNELADLNNDMGRVGDGNSGLLIGDSLLRGVMSKVRTEFTKEFDLGTDGQTTLSLLGVRSDQYGKLSLDDAELNSFIDKDIDNVQAFFIGTDSKPGFAKSFDDLLDFYTKSDGLIQGRIDSKEKQLDKLDNDRASFDRRMESLESRLFAQYNAMDLLVAGMNSTSSYLMQQLDNMPGVVKKD